MSRDIFLRIVRRFTNHFSIDPRTREEFTKGRDGWALLGCPSNSSLGTFY